MIEPGVQHVITRICAWIAIGFVWPMIAPGDAPAAKWPDQRQIGFFICHADFSMDPLIPFFHDIARLQQELVSQLGVAETKETIHIYLFAKRSTYQRYLRRHFPNVPERRALFIKGHGPGMVFAYASGDFQTDLRHECTHALLHASLPMVPLWLDEGLAEYFELPTADRLRGSPHAAAVRRNLLFGRYANLTELESISSVGEMNGREYRHAWAWVHFMLHGPPVARDELRKFLNDIYNHTPPGNLSNRLPDRLPELDHKFRRHFRRIRLAHR